MTSPLSGSIRATVGAAFAGIFLPATLYRGNQSFSCLAIYEEYGRNYGLRTTGPATNVKALILASTLATEPVAGDRVTIRQTTFAQGESFIVLSTNQSKPAVSIDPAGAVWTLLGHTISSNDGPEKEAVALADLLGSPHDIYRYTGSSPLAPQHKVGSVNALMLYGGGSGYNVGKSLHPDEILENCLVDPDKIQVGDFLVGPRTYFVSSIEPHRPVSVVLCSRTITLARGNSQLDADGGSAEAMPSQHGGLGTYWGSSSEPDNDTVGPGEFAIASNVPAALQALAGSARGQGQVPSDAPGPNRWRGWLPPSVFPKGSVKSRDILIDDLSNRYQIMTDDLTGVGYKIEMIRLES